MSRLKPINGDPKPYRPRRVRGAINHLTTLVAISLSFATIAVITVGLVR